MNLSFNIYSILLEIYILTCCCYILLFGVIFSYNLQYGYLVITKSTSNLFIQILILSFFLIYNQNPIYLITWNNFLFSNSFVFYSKIIIMILVISWYSVIIYSIYFDKIHNFEYWVLILLNLVSLLLLLQANDLLVTYLLIEFQSLIFYILASVKRNSEFSTEAGIKYFILGAFSSTFLLFGFSLLYSVTGLLKFYDLYFFFINSFNYLSITLLLPILLSLIFILISIFFKLNIAPFHIWAPDVYEGSINSITTYFAIMPKLTLLSVLLKLLLLIFYDFNYFWNFLLLFCIISSSFIGTFSAFIQSKWKRFIVYSSISHLSFFLIPIVVNNLQSINYLFSYVIIYLVMSLGFFAFFINLYFVKFPFVFQIRFFSYVTSFVILNPLLAFILIVIIFSMAGIPPLAGFFIKFFVLTISIKSNLYLVTFIVLVLNCVSCFYYMKLIKNIYFSFKIPNLFNFYLTFNKISIIFLSLCFFILVLSIFDFELLFLVTNLLTYSFI